MLDGKDGMDTIKAYLGSNSLAPKLANIEKGIFTRTSTQDLTLDLTRAQAMTSVSLKGFDCNTTIHHATALSSFTASNSNKHSFTLNDIDVSKVMLQKLNFSALTDAIVGINTLTDTGFTAMEVSLNDSSVTLKDEAIAGGVTLYSNGTKTNTLVFDQVSTMGISSLTLVGKAALDLFTTTGAFTGLTNFDATQMSGNVEVHIGGAALAKVVGSSGNDDITLGDLANSATIELRSGDDILALEGAVSNQTFDGGTGTDTLQINGAKLPSFLSSFTNFETLNVEKAKGGYSLNSNWTTLIFSTDNLDSKKFANFSGGTGLTSVTGSNQNDIVYFSAMGGTTLKMAHVDLLAGDDNLNLFFAPDITSQTYDGGSGYDSVSITGNLPVASLFTNFEVLSITDAGGTYNFTNTGFDAIQFNLGFMSAVTLDQLASGTKIRLGFDHTAPITVKVVNAATLQTEGLEFVFTWGATLGSSAGGLSEYR